MSVRCFWTEGFKTFRRRQDRSRIYKNRINTRKKKNIFLRTDNAGGGDKKRRISYCHPKIGLECLGRLASVLCDKPRVSSCSICQWQYQLPPEDCRQHRGTHYLAARERKTRKGHQKSISRSLFFWETSEMLTERSSSCDSSDTLRDNGDTLYFRPWLI